MLDSTMADSTSPRSRSLKRQHDDSNASSETIHLTARSKDTPSMQQASSLSSTPNNFIRAQSPAHSDTGSTLSDAGTHTPTLLPNSPQQHTAFSALNGMAQPPSKKVKLTFAEQEQRKILKEIQAREERAKREMEKREKEQNKARRDAEKEAKRQKKEAEQEEKKAVKEAERAEKEEQRRAREAEKRKKEEEKLRLEEEKRKKERSQQKLNAFFIKPKVEKKQKEASPELKDSTATLSDMKPPNKHSETSEYDKIFPPFFVQNNIIVAPITRFERDDYATKRLETELDAYVSDSKSIKHPTSFDAAKAFNMPEICFPRRGKRCVPVKQIMSRILGGSSRPIDLTTDSQNQQIKSTRALLKEVPYKFLKFAEDVRPPYTGTYTKEPVSGMRKLARSPTKRDLPGVDYDYDSEAEWEEPGEDEEDLASEGDDEDDVDGEEDLDGFLDDADDELTKSRKLVMQGDLEPKSTGICWEDEKGLYPNPEMRGFAMEIINENIKVGTPIDPRATHYWASPSPAHSTMNPPRVPLHPMKGTSASVNGPSAKTVKMFGLSTSSDSKSASTSHASKGPKKFVAAEDMKAFRDAVQGSELSKIGLIEVLNKQFSKVPKSSIKNTLEAFARREGVKEVDKRWVWKEEGVK